MPKQTPTTADEARQYAIDWQNYAGDKANLSYGEMNDWQETFVDIANEFGLYDEFKENGIT